MKRESVRQTMRPQQRFNVTLGQALQVSLRARAMKTILTTNFGAGGDSELPLPVYAAFEDILVGHVLNRRKTTLSTGKFDWKKTPSLAFSQV